MEPKQIQNNIPKRAISRPNVISSIFFIIILLIYVPNTLFAGVQLFFAIYLAPLAIVELFLAYSFGIVLAKYNYNRVKRGNLFLPYLILVVIHIVCIAVCLAIEFWLAGYPIKDCFDTCTKIDTITAVVRYSIVSSVLFLPAYCAIFQYRRWILKYNLPNPNKN